MANIFFKDGKWWLNYRLNGRRYRRSTRTANKRLAETMLKELGSSYTRVKILHQRSF